MNRVSATNLECILSQCEKIVAQKIAWGQTKKEIANDLFRSEDTISAHLRNIYAKLGIHKETDLCRWWIFYEYAIADNPLKKVIVMLFLVLSISAVVSDQKMLRVFKTPAAKSFARVVKPVKARQTRNVYELQLITA